jgi:hypothetical protein
MNKWRRYEVTVPVQFNDGTPVPTEWIGEAMVELLDFFGGVSFETQMIEGRWQRGGLVYQDNSVRLVVDIPDTTKNRRWMKSFKLRWKTRLKQLEIWMVSYRIEVE